MWGPDRVKGKLEALTGKAKEAVALLTDSGGTSAEGRNATIDNRVEGPNVDGADHYDDRPDPQAR
jgi:uncharacterized protein YjbJ (UPF0337 family)